MSGPDEKDALVKNTRLAGERHRRWLSERDQSVWRRLGQVGVLGWMIVVPMLLGVALGRFIDARLQTGIFWTAPLLLAGLALGCWSAWKWMRNS